MVDKSSNKLNYAHTLHCAKTLINYYYHCCFCSIKCTRLEEIRKAYSSSWSSLTYDVVKTTSPNPQNLLKVILSKPSTTSV